jgi:hypothetical protein
VKWPLPTSEGVNAVPLKSSLFDLEGTGQLVDDPELRLALAVLEATDLPPIDFREFGEPFLGVTAFLAPGPEVRSERFIEVDRGLWIGLVFCLPPRHFGESSRNSDITSTADKLHFREKGGEIDFTRLLG